MSERPLLLRALDREPAEHTPVWLMRQAGRYLPEYRELRARHSLLEMCREPDLAAEVTLQPLKRFALDAAIIFADILLPLDAIGLGLEFASGEGPLLRNPIADARAIDLLPVPPAGEALRPTLEAIALVRRELEGSGRALIGFAGAPFTLASYAIEGATSRSFQKTKGIMYREPSAWKRLMTKLTTLQIDYLAAQATAGAEAVQLFDSWAGIALGREEYREYVLPYNRAIFEALTRAGIKSVSFSTGTAAYIEEVAAAGGDAIGVDWRLPIDELWGRIGPERAIQGNLDPALLLAGWGEVERRTADILDRAGGRPGHIFNLGHGVLPETPPEIVARLVDFVHERSVASAVDRPMETRASAAVAGHARRAELREDAVATRRAAPAREAGGKIGVLVMAYGGPSSLEELPGYLADIRSGRVTTPEVLEEISDHYRRIGGRSPLLEITRRQAEGIAAFLDPSLFRCYLGMRHWAPWIDEVVATMADEGVSRAVSLVMAPHYSTMSIARYRAKIRDGLAASRRSIEFAHIDEYHDAPGLIGALSRRVRQGIEAWPERERDAVHVVFSAHSLPVRIMKEGDPYDAQLRETARLVAAKAGLRVEQWSWSYQSAGKSPEPWLGPQLEEHIPALVERGIRRIVSVPVGFLADHVELLYDIDIEAREVAERLGARLVRPPAINDDPELMAELARLVRRAAARWTGETAA